MPGSSVPMNQALPRSAVEKLDGGHSLFRCPGGCPLKRGTKRRFLGAVADRGGAGFPHILFR